MKRHLLLMALLMGILSGGFVLLVYYFFGFGWHILGACMLAGVMDWCLVEIALEVNQWKVR